ncbi:hypothetical protein BV898_15628 [Hypsibius exemplaris]|uniref:Uncharacterized protein n=1 Tax=Hypsibius exemplaris TaxID=2072580 RepID=A0A9X6NI61_HYPEX|nr:hypothetical protein BV898_15628 [Hypsibius exemplaris]
MVQLMEKGKGKLERLMEQAGEMIAAAMYRPARRKSGAYQEALKEVLAKDKSPSVADAAHWASDKSA